MDNIVDQLREEIEKRRTELNALESALSVLTGGKATKTRKARNVAEPGAVKATRKPRTQEQRDAQAERMKEMHARKKAEREKANKA